MRMNSMTKFDRTTRCMVFNDTTSYMATRFFIDVNKPNDDFEIIEVVTTVRGLMNLYYNEVEDLYMIGNEDAYKLFRGADFEEIIREIRVKAMINNAIFDCEIETFQLNECRKGRYIVFDAPSGLLGRSSDEEINTFLESNGRLFKKVLVKEGEEYKEVEIFETDYYYVVDNIVFNKRFNILNELAKEFDLDKLIEKVSVEISIINKDNVCITKNGEYIKNTLTGKVVKLNNKYVIGSLTVSGIVSKVKDEATSIPMLLNMVVAKIEKNNEICGSFITIEEFENEEKKKDIFYLFKM